MQSLVLKDNRKKSLERGQLAASVLPERQIRDLEMAFREIEIKSLADLQALVNFGFKIEPADYKTLSDADVFKRFAKSASLNPSSRNTKVRSPQTCFP